jgi:hypothetical protein
MVAENKLLAITIPIPDRLPNSYPSVKVFPIFFQIYPYLRTLLTFDTQGLLNVISIAFEETEFNTELGKCQKQRLVDILLQVWYYSNLPPTSPWMPLLNV